MKIIFILIAIISLTYGQSKIKSDSDSLAKYIGYWPPSIVTSEDSMALFKGKLSDYIDKIKNNKYGIRDSAVYYFRLGQAYYFGHNIDMDNSYDLAEKYLKKSISLNPKALDARIELGIMYSESDPNKFYEAYKLLFDAVNEDKQKKYIDARYSLAMCALNIGEDLIARKTAKDYLALTHSENDSMSAGWLDFINYRYKKFIITDTTDGLITYKNLFSGFEVKYPNIFTHDFDDMYSSLQASSVLSLKTPKAYSVITDSITNAIFVVARNAKYYKYEDLIDAHLAGMAASPLKNRKSNVIYKNNKSLFFQTTFRPYENYKGAITAIKGDSFHFLLIYNATESTFEQNYKYFNDFEKSFKMIAILKE